MAAVTIWLKPDLLDSEVHTAGGRDVKVLRSPEGLPEQNFRIKDIEADIDIEVKLDPQRGQLYVQENNVRVMTWSPSPLLQPWIEMISVFEIFPLSSQNGAVMGTWGRKLMLDCYHYGTADATVEENDNGSYTLAIAGKLHEDVKKLFRSINNGESPYYVHLEEIRKEFEENPPTPFH